MDDAPYFLNPSINDEIFETTMWIRYIELCCGIISIIGGLFIIIAFLFYKNLRSFAFELVIYLTISSMGNTFSYLLLYIDQENIIIRNMTLCITQAFMIITFEISQMIWITLIGYSVYEYLINFEEIDFSQKTSSTKRLVYLCIGFLTPIPIAFLGLVFNLFGPSGRWCWVNPTTSDIWEEIYSYSIIGLIWILVFTNIFLNCLVIKYLNKLCINPQEQELASRFTWKLITYPIIQIVSILPATLNRLIFTFTNSFFLPIEILAIIFLSLQGLAYAIAYGYNPQVRLALIDTFNKIFKCKKRASNITHNNESFVSSQSIGSKGFDKKLNIHDYSSFLID